MSPHPQSEVMKLNPHPRSVREISQWTSTPQNLISLFFLVLEIYSKFGRKSFRTSWGVSLMKMWDTKPNAFSHCWGGASLGSSPRSTVSSLQICYVTAAIYVGQSGDHWSALSHLHRASGLRWVTSPYPSQGKRKPHLLPTLCSAALRDTALELNVCLFWCETWGLRIGLAAVVLLLLADTWLLRRLKECDVPAE